jgi:Domain of unknown function (DUF4332)
MTRCNCCGQSLPRHVLERQALTQPSVLASVSSGTSFQSTRSTVWVDDALLEACNRAHDEAIKRGAPEVTVFYLAYVIAIDRHDGVFLRDVGLEPRAMLRAVEGLLPWGRPTLTRLDQRGRLVGEVRTSQDFKRLIDKTRAAAERRGRRSATLVDCIDALIFDHHDFDCRRALSDFLSRTRRESRHLRSERDDRSGALDPAPTHLDDYSVHAGNEGHLRGFADRDRTPYGANSHIASSYGANSNGANSNAGRSSAERWRSHEAEHGPRYTSDRHLIERPPIERPFIAPPVVDRAYWTTPDRDSHRALQLGLRDFEPQRSEADRSQQHDQTDAQARLERMERMIASLSEQLAERERPLVRNSVPRAKSARRASVSVPSSVSGSSTAPNSASASGSTTSAAAASASDAITGPTTRASAEPNTVASSASQSGATILSQERTPGVGLARHLRRVRRSAWGARLDVARGLARSISGGTLAALPERTPRLSLVRSNAPNPANLDELIDDDDVPHERDEALDDASEFNERGERAKRFYLALEDDIVRAPSIGPRTAARLMPHGLERVRQLLVCSPHEVAVKVGARHITAQKIRSWQDQARLVCTVPWLRGTHAQLLVGAQYTTVDKIINCDAAKLFGDVLAFAATRDGQSVLRSSPPPDIQRISNWIAYARLAELDRVA